MLRKLMFFVCVLVSIQCFSQLTIEAAIKRISQVTNSFSSSENSYIYSFSDSTKHTPPYLDFGKMLGTLQVQSSRYPDCKLLYQVFEYDNNDNRDYALKKIGQLGIISNCHGPSPFEPYFSYKKYFFYIGGDPCSWSRLDDRYKYMSVKIHDDIENDLKYNKD